MLTMSKVTEKKTKWGRRTDLVPKFPSFKVLGARGAGMAERTGNQMSRRVKLAALFFYHAETLER